MGRIDRLVTVHAQTSIGPIVGREILMLKSKRSILVVASCTALALFSAVTVRNVIAQDKPAGGMNGGMAGMDMPKDDMMQKDMMAKMKSAMMESLKTPMTGDEMMHMMAMQKMTMMLAMDKECMAMCDAATKDPEMTKMMMDPAAMMKAEHTVLDDPAMMKMVAQHAMVMHMVQSDPEMKKMMMGDGMMGGDKMGGEKPPMK